MNEKTFTEKELLKLLAKQRESDANILTKEINVSGYTAKQKVIKNKLVYEKVQAKQD